MAVQVRCPHASCGRPVQVAEALRGRPVQCPSCRRPFVVPSPQPAAAAAATLSLPPLADASRAPAPPPTAALAPSAAATLTTPPTARLADAIQVTPTVAAAASPSRIGRFLIQQRLGEGAFGVVYRAHDTQLDRTVALKVAKAGTVQTAQHAERFLREARSAAQLRHPNIVPLYEAGEEGGSYYIAAAFIPGATLEQTLEAGRPDFRRAAQLVRRLAEALTYAHRQGIVHRDVKPANVLLDEQGEPLLTDFGLATRQHEAEKLTQAGVILGTPLYMAPEQARDGSEAQPASDQYSVGVVLYEMLTGRTPFAGPPELVLFHHIETPPPAPRSVSRAVPRDLETICLKCLEKDPARRYADCQALADDLRRWLEHEPIQARRIGRLERLARWRRRKPALAASLLALAVTLLVAGGVSVGLAGRASQNQQQLGEKEAALEVSEEARAEKEIEAQKSGKEVQLKGAEARAADLRKHQREYIADMQDVQTAWQAGQVDRVRELLARYGEPRPGMPDPRAFEWYYWRRVAAAGARLTVPAKGIPAAFSADSGLLAVPDGETVTLWNVATGQAKGTLGKLGRAIERVAFSPDGRLLAAGATSALPEQTPTPGVLKVWEADSGRALVVIGSLPAGTLHALAFGPNGGTLAAAWNVPFKPGGAAAPNLPGLHFQAWDVASGKERTNWTLGQMREPNYSQLFFDKRDSRFTLLWPEWNQNFSLSAQARGLTWNPSNGTRGSGGGQHFELHRMAVPLNLTLKDRGQFDLLVTPGGHVLVLVPRAGIRGVPVRVIRPEQWMALEATRGEETTCWGFSSNSELLATAGSANVVRVWKIGWAGEKAAEFRGHTSPVTALTFSPDNRYLAGVTEKEARVWDLEAGPEYATSKGRDSGLNGGTHSADGRWTTGVSNGHLAVVDAATQQVRFTVGDFRHAPYHRLALSADGRRLAYSSRNELKVWDAAAGLMLTRNPAGPLRLMHFSPDGRLLVGVRTDGPAVVYRVDDDKQVTLAGNKSKEVEPHFLYFTPDGKQLRGHLQSRVIVRQIAHFESRVSVWDPETGKELQGWDIAPSTVAMFLADGRAVSLKGGRVVDLATGQVLAAFEGTKADFRDVAFSPDGRRLATADGQTVRLWDTDTRLEVLALACPGLGSKRTEGKGLRFSPDGTSLIDDCQNGRIWEAPRAAAGAQQ